jgi:hypothetical protein
VEVCLLYHWNVDACAHVASTAFAQVGSGSAQGQAQVYSNLLTPLNKIGNF